MALKIEKKSIRSKHYELNVMVRLLEFENTNVSLHEFPERFMDRVGEIKKASTGTADTFYKAILADDYKQVDIWHLDCHGTPDRLMATVTDDGQQNNPFNF